MQVGIGEANEDVPPVVEQRDEPRREPATGEIVRRKAAPAPLVLHLVEDVFPVAAVAIELTERFRRLVERGDQNRVFVDLRRLADLSERKLRRAAIVVVRKTHRACQAPPEHDCTPLPASDLEPNRAFLSPKGLTGVAPRAAAELYDQAPNVLSQAYCEKIEKTKR